jgi:hypothetical protein
MKQEARLTPVTIAVMKVSGVPVRTPIERTRKGQRMSKWKLTIVVDDIDADQESNPIATAVSNLEYDSYKIVSWEEEKV